MFRYYDTHTTTIGNLLIVLTQNTAISFVADVNGYLDHMKKAENFLQQHPDIPVLTVVYEEMLEVILIILLLNVNK